MLGAGTIINPIIKIVTTVVILGAVYLFIVKPTLDTTNNVVGQSLDSFNESFEGFNTLPDNVQSQIDDAFDETDSQALQDCIQRAIADSKPERVGERVQRCTRKFGP
jgi:hypothetical protein